MNSRLLESLESRRVMSASVAPIAAQLIVANSQTRIAASETGIVAPTGFTVEATSESSLKLTWIDNSTGENRYRYESATSADFGMSRTTATVPMNATTASLTGLMPGTRYYVRVRAENGYDVSDYATLTIDTPAAAGQSSGPSPFGTPTNVAVSNVTATTATLSWEDNATAENRYRIMRSTSANFDRDLWMVTPGPNATSYTLTGLEAGKTYYVRVRAENGPNVSQWGNVVTLTPSLPTPPAAPSGLKVYDVFKTPGTLKVAWADNATNETGFVLERSYSADFATSVAIQLPANTTEYTDTGLPNWAITYYRVKAVGAAGDSAVSNSDWNRPAESDVRSVTTTDASNTDWTAVSDSSAEGGSYLSDGNTNKGNVSYGFWTSSIYAKVEIKYHSLPGSASNVPIVIEYDDASPQVIYLDQRTGGDQWVSLGLLAPAYIRIGNENTDGIVTLDAIRVTEMATPQIIDIGNDGGAFASNGVKVVTNDPANINGDYTIPTPYDTGEGEVDPFYYVSLDAAMSQYNGNGNYQVWVRYAQNDDASVPIGKWVDKGLVTVAYWSSQHELYFTVPSDGPKFAIDAVLFRFVYSDF